MPVKWRVEFAEGPRAGDKQRLKPSETVVIGRTKNTIDLLDPGTSARHAEITWREDRFWIRDLGSANGTLVDGVGLDGSDETGVPLADNSRVMIGETVLVLHEERSLLPQWVYWVALIVLAITSPFFIGTILEFRLFDQIHPQIGAPEPVRGHQGLLSPIDEYTVLVDRCFMREVGAEARNARIRRVTDFDNDGVSEIWVEGPSWERVYTFAPNGDWRLLADLPAGCQNSRGSGFPTLTCGAPTYANEVFVWRPGVPFAGPSTRRGCSIGSNKGHYALRSVSGAFVWVNARGETDSPPTVWHVGMPDAELSLSSFLADRGVTRPVHYVICEDFFPGISAQAVTDRGQVVKLTPGCGQAVKIDGNRAKERFGNNRPLAMAFTHTGRRQLLLQMNEYLGGSNRDHFQNGRMRSWHDAISQTPTRITSDYLAFTYQTPRPFDPIAVENRSFSLQRGVRLKGLNMARRAEDWSWAQGGGDILRTPCGEYVQVEAGPARCAFPCLSGAPSFACSTWTRTGHGSSATSLGKCCETDDEVEVSIEIQDAGPGMVPQATYATVAVRDRESCNTTEKPEQPELVPFQY